MIDLPVHIQLICFKMCKNVFSCLKDFSIFVILQINFK